MHSTCVVFTRIIRSDKRRARERSRGEVRGSERNRVCEREIINNVTKKQTHNGKNCTLLHKSFLRGSRLPGDRFTKF